MKKILLLLVATRVFQMQSQTQCWRDLSYGGSSNLFALRNDNSLWAWIPTETATLEVFTQIGTDSDWQMVSAGDHHGAAIKIDGTLWAWGWNMDGQLGNGTTTNTTTPIQVGANNDWHLVSGGGSHTLAIKNDGTLWAWGSNYNGQIGINDFGPHQVPMQVGTDTDWQTISAGYDHSMALKNDGSLWGWGANYSGELGFGYNTVSQVRTPTRVNADNDWKTISTGMWVTAAIKNNGTLWMWGNNYHGTQATGDTQDVHAVRQVGTDTDWLDVSTEMQFTLALKTNHTIWSWGSGSFGQQGNGTTDTHFFPVQIGSVVTWEKISSNLYHGSGIRNDARFYTWGHNFTGGSNPHVIGCTALGSISETEVKPLVIYPNPTQDYLQIFNPENETLTQLTITDITGKIVLQQNAPQHPIDVSKLRQGVYLLHLQLEDDNNRTQRFIKL